MYIELNGVRLMIGLQANGASRHYLPDQCERIDVAGIDYVSIAVARLGRSIDFYTQNFGFFVVEEARGGQEPYVLMRAPGDFYMAIYERRDERAQAREATRRWSFLVNDLDHVRVTVWNLGLATKGDCDEPTQIHRWRKDRSFLVCDPDGHEIELVERWSGRHIQVALVGAPSSRRTQET